MIKSFQELKQFVHERAIPSSFYRMKLKQLNKERRKLKKQVRRLTSWIARLENEKAAEIAKQLSETRLKYAGLLNIPSSDGEILLYE